MSNDYNDGYVLSQEIKDEIDIDFCKTFINELHNIFGFSISEFTNEFIWYVEETGGWYEAFTTTCRKLKKDDLMLYYMELAWYDAEMFASEITQILIERNIILADIENEEKGYVKMMTKQKGLQENDIFICDSCQSIFLSKYKKEYKEKLADGTFVLYELCPNCYMENRYMNNELTEEEEKEHTKNPNPPTYAEELPINREEILVATTIWKDKDLFTCPNCKKIHLVANKNSNGQCNFCYYQSLAENETKNANAYYKQQIKENREYTKQLKERNNV